jgi:flagellar hook-basal body complex protein FliE
VETSAQKAAEAAAVAVAQRASAEINTLKAALAALEKKLEEAAASPSTDAIDELTEKVDALATTVRAVVADADEAAEAAGKSKAEFAQTLAGELKSVRDEIKKAAKSAAQSVDKVEASLEAIRAVVSETRVNPPVASAPAEIEETEEEEEVEVIEEIEEEEAVAPSAPQSTAAGTGTALIVNLMIGIGNKPFVRGNGPGLSQDKGVPMSFLGIGRWQWISPDPEAPATIEVWKNDQSPLGEPLHISGGEPLEVDEGHFGGV